LRWWTARRWVAAGEDPQEVETRLRQLSLAFEPADLISEVMSLGSPAPIEVAVSGPKLDDLRAYAEKLHAQLSKIASLRDLRFAQSLEYPTVEVVIDRQKSGMTGVSVQEIARSLAAATSSSRFLVPNFWRNPTSGIGYQVQVEIPQALMRSPKDVELVPVKGSGEESPLHDTGNSHPLLLRDVADVRPATMPGEVDRYNMRRLISLTANIAGEDLGRVRQKVLRALAAAGKPPEGVQVDVRGQLVPMQELFEGLGFGLFVAVVVILLLLTGYFQSLRLALTALAVLPAVFFGVVLALLLTRTTLNIQSFIGAIMAIGVAVANAILLVAFAEQYRRQGHSAEEAGRLGARSRIRIAMTSLAMIAGMLPMARVGAKAASRRPRWAEPSSADCWPR
jgi:multidrug efflux pump subunit AcrB